MKSINDLEQINRNSNHLVHVSNAENLRKVKIRWDDDRLPARFLPSGRRQTKFKKTKSGKFNRTHYSRMQRRSFSKKQKTR